MKLHISEKWRDSLAVWFIVRTKKPQRLLPGRACGLKFLVDSLAVLTSFKLGFLLCIVSSFKNIYLSVLWSPVLKWGCLMCNISLWETFGGIEYISYVLWMWYFILLYHCDKYIYIIGIVVMFNRFCASQLLHRSLSYQRDPKHTQCWHCAAESSLKQTREIYILFIMYYYKNLDSAFPYTFMVSEGVLLYYICEVSFSW